MSTAPTQPVYAGARPTTISPGSCPPSGRAISLGLGGYCSGRRACPPSALGYAIKPPSARDRVPGRWPEELRWRLAPWNVLSPIDGAPTLVWDSTRVANLRVAIVGSGPASIAAAWRFAEAGEQVTVFEKDDCPGGILSLGIPDFTLPRVMAGSPWRVLRAAGVNLHCKTFINANDILVLSAQYDAVILAHGAGTQRRLGVPGSGLLGVVDATSFLKGARASMGDGDLRSSGPFAALGGTHATSPTILVVGAGNTGMVAARMARRLGARAICVGRSDRRLASVRPGADGRRG